MITSLYYQSLVELVIQLHNAQKKESSQSSPTASAIDDFHWFKVLIQLDNVLDGLMPSRSVKLPDDWVNQALLEIFIEPTILETSHP